MTQPTDVHREQLARRTSKPHFHLNTGCEGSKRNWYFWACGDARTKHGLEAAEDWCIKRDKKEGRL